MSIENGLTHEDIQRQAIDDGLHAEHAKFTVEQIKKEITDLQPKADAENPYYQPLSRLQAFWELEIAPLPDGPEKEELATLYDQKAFELFAAEIQVPEKHEAPNPSYDPQKRLMAVDMAIRAFPFAKADVMERLFALVDEKAQALPGRSEISHDVQED